MSKAAPEQPTTRQSRWPYEQIVIEDVEPSLGPARPVKAIVGEICIIEATIFRHGHDRLCAVVQAISPSGGAVELPMVLVNAGLDRWRTALHLAEVGRYRFTVAAWTDHYVTWIDELGKRVAAAQPDAVSEVAEGLSLVERALESQQGEGRRELERLLSRLRDVGAQPERVLQVGGGPEARALMARFGRRDDLAALEPPLEIMSDRPGARFSAWYELFVRSQAREPGQPGTFTDAIAQLPRIRDLGFDVVYLAPIHPIGRTNRKGPNNRVGASPDEPGSPWAIGSEHGGHTAIEPALGALADFDRFVAETAALGMEVALDLAIQCSPDHPWVREHPEWFYRRPDGSIRFAENPPKKYEDIYPLNFDTPDWRSLWEALRQVVQFWVDRGVRIFRVDNPHTKPIGFWTWLIAEIHKGSPDVLFLAEAFTRPPMMKALGSRGFSQSYTYFTWRNTKSELTAYLTELTRPEIVRCYRPNFFANTPDILPPILQHGGRAAFKMRVTLAATLSPAYGIYSGYELCEAEAIPGREEYLNSEKYEIKTRDWNAPGNINDFIIRVNRARQQCPALHLFDNLRFLDVGDDNLIAYVKSTPDRSNSVITIVNLDPHGSHASTVRVPAHEIGVAPEDSYEVFDVLTDRIYVWHEINYVRLDPLEGEPAHILVVRRGN